MVPHGLSAIRSYYGNPVGSNGQVNTTWYNANIVRVKLPFPMRIAWDTPTSVTSCLMHKKAAVEFAAIMQDIYNYARVLSKKQFGYDKSTAFYNEKTLLVLKALGLDLFGGTYNFRLIRGSSTSVSTHGFGIAIDIDPSGNPLGYTKGRMPSWVVDLFKKRGWKWGGEYNGRKDFMHFQRCTGY